MTRTRLLPRRMRGGRPLRVAVIGSARCTAALRAQLASSGVGRCVIVGRIAVTDERIPRGGADPPLGRLGSLSRLVSEHRIDLLVMSEDTPSRTVFEEALDTCTDLPVRLCTVAYFYECVFGHVRISEIDATWFHCVMHPRYRRFSPWKRAVDVLGALLAALLFLPVLLALAALIRRDGGPVLFKQTRIGEGGRPFVLYKLRSMKVSADSAAQWAPPDDPRVTRLGRVLRRTHIDELPQILNVLRGEMSLVGPRPEQPEFVDRLEKALPFYQRRHLIRPGITGWAQIRCGYAGSDLGSAWKLCHDLYYMKYRSFLFDLTILVRTVWTLCARAQQAIEPSGVAALASPVAAMSEDDLGDQAPVLPLAAVAAAQEAPSSL